MLISFLLKIMLLSVGIIIIRGTLPRYRVDNFIYDVWKEWVFILLFFFF